MVGKRKRSVSIFPSHEGDFLMGIAFYVLHSIFLLFKKRHQVSPMPEIIQFKLLELEDCYKELSHGRGNEISFKEFAFLKKLSL